MAAIVTGELYKEFDGKLQEIKIGGQFPSVIHAADLIPEYTDNKGNKRKWEVVEDVEPTPDLEVKKLKFKSFLKLGDGRHIGGEEIRRRAVRRKGNLGLSDAPRFLKQQKDIPIELRGKYMVLPGTKLRDSDGNLNVPSLYWSGDQWVLRFYWLVFGWHDYDRFACSE
jgi:hypothetical protein